MGEEFVGYSGRDTVVVAGRADSGHLEAKHRQRDRGPAEQVMNL